MVVNDAKSAREYAASMLQDHPPDAPWHTRAGGLRKIVRLAEETYTCERRGGGEVRRQLRTIILFAEMEDIQCTTARPSGASSTVRT